MTSTYSYHPTRRRHAAPRFGTVRSAHLVMALWVLMVAALSLALVLI